MFSTQVCKQSMPCIEKLAQDFLLFCLCTENLPVQTSKSKTNNIICLCPLCKQIIKSPQSAQLIIMIITLSPLVLRQILE